MHEHPHDIALIGENKKKYFIIIIMITLIPFTGYLLCARFCVNNLYILLLTPYNRHQEKVEAQKVKWTIFCLIILLHFRTNDNKRIK